ncbi:MAG TPA: hypothetical protein VF665_23505 [Longimicrobium sp.]|jgi:hypothetical protein|uniref:hypothetical protein n=1 Tax=Longimicrobium sp. TaxID=2029185 RepID=UPI002ED99D77
MTATTFPSPPARAEVDAAPLHPVPRRGAVLRAQLRATRDAIQKEAMLAGLFVLGVGIFLLASRAASPTGRPSDMQFAEVILPLVLMGVFGPVALWKGEAPARRSYFWSMPVDRMPHTLFKVFSGWVWLMALAAAYVLWAWALARLSGGVLSLGDTQVALPVPQGAPRGSAGYAFHPWPVPAWQWVVPFTAATTMYLLGSIVVIRSNYPWRWFAGVVLTWVLLLMVQGGAERFLIDVVAEGRYGLEVLLTGGETRTSMIPAPGGERVLVAYVEPMPERWAIATLLWMGAALAGLILAARPHQEG